MSIVYQSEVNAIHRADARAVAAQQEPGSFSLAVLDGPYGMRKAAWDMMKVAELPEWYAPHLDDVGRLCAPSASLYVWNTAEGWATLHPGIVARGWVFRSMIVWADPNPASVIGWAVAQGWPNAHEVCGFYTRGSARARHAAPVSDVWVQGRHTWGHERLCTGRTVRAKTATNQHGGGTGLAREALHPCQKPLAFADRIIRASTRPGERVWVPFGGTCREAVAVEWMARAEPDEARRVVTCEIDQDGRDYLGAVVRQLRGEDVRRRDPRQTGLFG